GRMTKWWCEQAQGVSAMRIAPAGGGIFQPRLGNHVTPHPVIERLACFLLHPVRESTEDDRVVEKVAAGFAQHAHLQNIAQRRLCGTIDSRWQMAVVQHPAAAENIA